MSRVLFALLIVSCVLGGWIYHQSTSEMEQLRNSLRTREGEIANHRAEIEGLRKENGRLQDEIKKFDQWIKTRSNFEVNKVQLKIKFDEIIKNFREAENLWARIDETPKPASKAGKDVEGDGASRSQRDVSKSDGTGTGPSGRGQTKDEGEKKEKGVLKAIGEKFGDIF